MLKKVLVQYSESKNTLKNSTRLSLYKDNTDCSNPCQFLFIPLLLSILSGSQLIPTQVCTYPVFDNVVLHRSLLVPENVNTSLYTCQSLIIILF
jgi:hypothetical protein